MKILLLGKNGQVGWELQRSLSPLGELIALDRHPIDGLSGDLSDLDALRGIDILWRKFECCKKRFQSNQVASAYLPFRPSLYLTQH